jgi:peptide-methionine (S)-S-oxide reductase
MKLFFAFILGFLAFAPVAQAETAYFAGGCFWCMESEFESEKGVIDVTSGYAGKGAEPTYKEVSSGRTGFVEAVRVEFDTTDVSYDRLLEIFWSNVDPLDDKGQFCDKGSQYVAAIFTQNDEEKAKAEKSLKDVEKRLGQKVATKIQSLEDFYAAEEYHQDYYKKNALQYKAYRNGCGRDERLEELKKK